ncbi:MAG: hypothetical protein ACK5MZ_09970 [Aestuariibaculum sp.]
MKTFYTILLIVLLPNIVIAQTKTIHTFVALCDNENQGIVPVPKSLGNGKDTKNNLYWGAAFGVKSFFKNKAENWKLVSTITLNSSTILERLLFKHKTKDVYMLADAYDGEQIKICIEDFLKASNSQLPVTITHNNQTLKFGGHANVTAYVGHDGLMDFKVSIDYNKSNTSKDVIILACYSKRFFSSEIKKSQANPVLWTTHLMAPEAYVLNAALNGWINNESGTSIDERAAQAYNKYQKCGIKGARNLFTTGF